MHTRPRGMILSVVLMVTTGVGSASAQTTPESLQDFVSRIPTGTSRVLGPAEIELAKKIQAFGPSAVPVMLALLKNHDDHVRFFAGYVFRDLSGVTERDLDALFAAERDGNGWVAPAIGRVRTPRAIQFLIEELKRNPEQGQVSWALVFTGTPGALALADLYNSTTPVENGVARLVSGIYARLGEEAVPAIGPLLETACNSRLDTNNRLFAIDALAAMRRNATAAVPRLKELGQAEPHLFQGRIDVALVHIGTTDAVPALLRELKAHPSDATLRMVASLGPNGHDAGPTVVKFLTHPDWDLRVSSASVLGKIGYTEATGELINALHNREDWRLVLASTRALGRLHASAAVEPLRALANSYWYPPVRTAASKAIRMIEGPNSGAVDKSENQLPTVSFDLERPQADADPLTGIRGHPTRGIEADLLSRDELGRHSYHTELVSYSEDGRQVHPRQLIAQYGLRIPGGLLLGSDHGEWGGELVFVDDHGKSQVLLSENVHGIHRLGDNVVVATGLARLTIDVGCLYSVELGKDTVPSVKRWKILPGAPRRSGVLETGDLFIACFGGSILVAPSGEISIAPFIKQTIRLEGRDDE